MSARPQHLLAYYCSHSDCRELLALLPAGALLYDTRLRCSTCGRTTKIVKRIDTPRAQVYTDSQLKPA